MSVRLSRWFACLGIKAPNTGKDHFGSRLYLSRCEEISFRCWFRARFHNRRSKVNKISPLKVGSASRSLESTQHAKLNSNEKRAESDVKSLSLWKFSLASSSYRFDWTRDSFPSLHLHLRWLWDHHGHSHPAAVLPGHQPWRVGDLARGNRCQHIEWCAAIFCFTLKWFLLFLHLFTFASRDPFLTRIWWVSSTWTRFLMRPSACIRLHLVLKGCAKKLSRFMASPFLKEPWLEYLCTFSTRIHAIGAPLKNSDQRGEARWILL